MIPPQQPGKKGKKCKEKQKNEVVLLMKSITNDISNLL